MSIGQTPTSTPPTNLTTTTLTMSVINISSNEQFNTLLNSSRVVVADCKSLGLSRYAEPLNSDPTFYQTIHRPKQGKAKQLALTD